MREETKLSFEKQNHFTVKIADCVIRINAPSPRTYIQCRDYIVQEDPDIIINISEEDALYEIKEGQSLYKSINENYVETLAAFRKIADELSSRGIILMHGAAIAIGNEAYLFSASSGVGKTTHIKKWIEHVNDSYVLNGDKPFIKTVGTEALIYGTPWCGKERMGKNAKAALKAIVFMERSEDNSIEEISFVDAYPYLLQHIYQPQDVLQMKAVLKNLSELNGKIKVFKFYFNNFKEDCFSTAFNALVDVKTD